MAEKIAEHQKKKNGIRGQVIYNLHEGLAYGKYVATAKAAGMKPLSYSAIKKACKAGKHVK